MVVAEEVLAGPSSLKIKKLLSGNFQFKKNVDRFEE